MFRFQQYKLPKEEVAEHITKLLKDVESQENSVLSHCDFHVRNIIYDEDTG